jgi:aspartyl-tRNA(Asn)/glutamyl-tRNA(Gln) amidotransferase subunit C
MTIEDLKETAELAHLNLSEAELEAAFPAFRQMLGYFAAMQAADEDEGLFPAGTGALPPGQNAGAHLVSSAHFRADVPSSRRDGERLVSNAGERDGPFLVVPNVL